MDHPERIPIDIGPELVAEADASSRETVREDGTIVIDALSPDGCVAEAGEDSDEIVVCEERPEGDDPIALKVRLSEDADATVVSTTTALPMGGAATSVMLRLRMMF